VKTMTWRELGGPCEAAHQGETADDIIRMQDRRLVSPRERDFAAFPES